MLNVRQLDVAYGDAQALWDVSLEVRAGEIVVLIGPNGAGKTTLMRTIAGLHRPRTGAITFEGTALQAFAAHQIVERGIILIPEGRRLFGGMTVLENLELGAYSRRARQMRAQTLQQVFESFPLLAERRHQRAWTLSGGQQQMVAIGRALMGLPRLLMLDEPSLGLAPLLVQQIFEIVKTINAQGVTIFLVEQNARSALALAQRAYIMEQGRVVGTGSGADLLNNDEVRQAYLGYAPTPAGIMSYASLAQNIVFGLFVGGIYGIAAVGLALVFGVLKVLNVAHGELLMLGGYVSFWVFSMFGVDPFISLLIGIPALFLLGLVLDRAIFRHVARLIGEVKIKNSLLVSFGLTLILQDLAIRLFTADERTIHAAYSGLGFNLFGVVLPYTRLLSLLIALVTILALHFFLHRTYPGKAILATAEDWEADELAGINVQRVYMLTFALSAALAGIAGTLVSVTYSITPSIGLGWTLKALIVVVLAGTGSILGAFPAGLLLGLVEAISGAFIGPSYREIVGLVIFLLVLLLRPQGLFGRA